MEAGVKATFFTVGDKEKNIMKRIVDEGHAIAVHTYTHKYEEVYASVPAFLDDFAKQYYTIFETTGVRPTAFRFPGGSNNSHNEHIRTELISEMSRRGFVFFDWNAVSNDSAGKRNKPKEQLEELTLSIDRFRIIVSLQHDSKLQVNTAEVTKKFIVKLKNAGYRFCTLDNTVRPVQFADPVDIKE